MSKFKRIVAAALLGISGMVNAANVSIDFEGTGAPAAFINTSPLTNYYSPQGVTFLGVNGLSGSILNQLGNFGFNARSGTDFFAYNTVSTGSVFQLSFSSAIDNFSIWAATSYGSTYSIEAFDANNNLVDSESLTGSTTWQELDVVGAAITRVILSAGNNQHGAFDDMTFSTGSNSVPEPGTLVLLGAALGCAGLLRRRKVV